MSEGAPKSPSAAKERKAINKAIEEVGKEKLAPLGDALERYLGAHDKELTLTEAKEELMKSLDARKRLSEIKAEIVEINKNVKMKGAERREKMGKLSREQEELEQTASNSGRKTRRGSRGGRAGSADSVSAVTQNTAPDTAQPSPTIIDSDTATTAVQQDPNTAIPVHQAPTSSEPKPELDPVAIMADENIEWKPTIDEELDVEPMESTGRNLVLYRPLNIEPHATRLEGEIVRRRSVEQTAAILAARERVLKLERARGLKHDEIKKDEFKRTEKDNYEAHLNELGKLQLADPENPRSTPEFYLKSIEFAEKRLEAEAAYTAALRKFHQEKSLGKVLTDQFVENGLPEDVQTLKSQWMKTRNGEAKFMLDNAHDRIRERGLESVRDAKGKSVLDRYQRRYVTKEVIFGSEEAELNARIEGLGSREKGMLEKTYDWYKKLPPGARIIGTSALLFGLSAIATGGAGVAVPAMLWSGGMAAARVFAEKIQDPAKKAALSSALQFLSVGSLAGLAGEKAVEGVHAMLGTKRKAKETLGNTEFKDLGLHNGMLDKVANERAKALRTEEDISRQKRAARTASSVIGGLAAGHLMHGGAHPQTSSHSEAAAGTTPEATNAAAELPPLPKTIPVDSSPAHNIDNTPHTDHAALSGAHESLSIHGTVNNADRLVGHFQHQLHEKYPDLEHAPASVKTLLEMKGGEDSITLNQFHLQDANGNSLVMHEGDSIELNDKGEIELRFADNHAPHILVSANGTVNSDTHDLSGQIQPVVHHAPAAHHEAAATHQEDPSDQLNRDSYARNSTSPWNSSNYENGPPDVASSFQEGYSRDSYDTPSTQPFDPEYPAGQYQSADTNAGSSTEAPTWAQDGVPPQPNVYGFDVAHPGPAQDSHGYIFAHIPRGHDPIGSYNDAAKSVARLQALEHPNTTVHYIHEHKGFFGNTIREVKAFIKLSGEQSVRPVEGDMPVAPRDGDLRAPKW